jgi:uncharacterized MAPEG superfamily protein
MPTNYSIFAIPAYYILTLWPHVYSHTLLRSANSRIDNSNPRSTHQVAKVGRAVPAATYAKWERARAAHANGIENMALAVAAVVLGNVARLDPGWLNSMLGGYLASRVVYTLLYLKIGDAKKSLARSMVWAGGVVMLLTIVTRAGLAVARDQ